MPFKGNGLGCGSVQPSWPRWGIRGRALEEGVRARPAVSCALRYGDRNLRPGASVSALGSPSLRAAPGLSCLREDARLAGRSSASPYLVNMLFE